ncbi:hypothetical protein DIPPA_25411 [Diplonema papillatum]|nr:hypothetical protein DIPPA_25411 [Diplonema papillatum]
MKVRRDRKYSYLASALDAVSKEQVVKSWGAAGLLRAVWNDVPPSTLTIYYDQYRRLAELDMTGKPNRWVQTTRPTKKDRLQVSLWAPISLPRARLLLEQASLFLGGNTERQTLQPPWLLAISPLCLW